MMQALLYLNSQKLSELNMEFSINTDVYADDMRCKSGKLRRDYIAEKKEFIISWKLLPWDDTDVADGGKGAAWITALSHAAAHTLRVYKESGTPAYDDYTVYLDTGSPKIRKNDRSASAWWYDVELILREQ